MKNRLRNSLLIIIGIICILPIGIKAEKKTEVSKTSCKILNIGPSGVVNNIGGVHRGYVYIATFDGQYGLCLAAGKTAKSGGKYGTAEEGHDSNVGRALNYLLINGAGYKNKNYIAAQVIAWTGGGGSVSRNIASAVIQFHSQNMSTSAIGYTQVRDAAELAKEILATEAIPYCIYRSTPGSQPFAVPKGNKPCAVACEFTITEEDEEKCPEYAINVASHPSTCKKNAVSSTATFSEQTNGPLPKGVKGDNDVNKYGRFKVGINNYCNIHCEEEVQISLPGAPNEVDIGNAVLTWPTSKKTNNNNEGANKFPLSFSGFMNCHIYVSSTKKACSYTNILDAYEKNKTYVDSHANSRVSICDAGDYKTKICTIISKSLDNTRLEWGDGGNHNSNYTMVKNYYKSTYHSKIENNKNSAQTDYNSAQTTYDAALASCKTGSHPGTAKTIYSPADGTCSDNKYPCSVPGDNVPNDESWCNGNDGTTKSAKEELDKAKEILDFWSNEESKSNTIMSQIDSYAHKYWSAEEILVDLRACEKYDFNGNAQSFYRAPFKSGATVVYDNKSYKLETATNANYTCKSGCSDPKDFREQDAIFSIGDLVSRSTLKDKIEKLMSREITLTTGEIEYKLNDKTGYKYIDVQNGTLTNTKPDGAFKELILPNIPLSEEFGKIKTKDKIELKIDPFGSNGQFSWGDTEYVCEFESKLPDACLCPPETNYAGLNLAYIQIAEGLTCADAQAKYCQKTNIDNIACPDGTHKDDVGKCINDKGGYTKDIYDACVKDICSSRYACPDGSKADEMTACIGDNYIDNYLGCYSTLCVCEECYVCDENTDYPDRVIDSCVAKNEKIYGSKAEAAKYCKQKMCYKYECPENTPNYKMDISNCVELYLKNGGYSLKDITSQDDSRLKAAIKACVNAVCPAKGIKIIYRTIKLENPFPSYDADSTTIKNLKKKTFNLDLSGRYPGSNWNGRILVYNEIINNRSDRQFSNEESINNTQSFIGSTLYQTKEPLYTFDLTPAIINQIRRYNDEQQRGNKGGYSDFTLTCKKNSSAACISDFIWGRTSAGNVGLDTSNSKCTNRTQDFYSCTNG